MNNKEKKKIKVKIMEEIKSIKEKIITLIDESKPIEPENAIGRVSRMDAINNKSIVESRLIISKQRLSKLLFMKKKINDNNFGKCNLCNQVIPFERLLILPESSKCVKCSK